MKKLKNQFFSYLTTTLFLMTASIQSVYADIDEHLSTDNNDIEQLENDISPLKSLANLQSLKHLNQYKSYQAPFVQELPNQHHVRTLFVSTQDLPIVDIQMTFKAGSAQDEIITSGTFGLSSMAARLMTEGTDQYTAKQIISQFESLGAQFSVSSYRDMFIVKLRVLSTPNKLQTALELMLHVINHATFNNSGLNLVKSNSKVGQKQILENPNRLMNIQFYRSLYQKHPYAEPSMGTVSGLSKINPELLKQFRNRLLVAQNMNIAITGDLDNSEATDIANTISNALPQGEKAPELPAPSDQSDNNIFFRPYNSTQAHVMIGHLGIKRNDPDRVALEVANQIFGGSGFNTILMQELRVKRGLTYGAYSNLVTTLSPGFFSYSYSTQQDQLMQSIQVSHKALVDFINQPIRKKQLEETKEGLLRSFPMTFSSNADINAQIGAIGFYDLPADYMNQYQSKLSKLTLKQVQDAIHKHLRADRLTMVIVASELDQDKLKNMLNQNLEKENPVNGALKSTRKSQ